MFDYEAAGSRVFAAFSAFAISAAVMAFAIIPGSPSGVIV